ncbi:hypothetical protein GCM10010965_26870 [Caldalkalibacillus thermarum]|uniref:acyl carrier protein n=1 Tax=Caldalkalibacillus thermarum TaxID=296745 RepID=UPI0016678291|nr:type I polyketide synthase [Caldalkalibacillus thermarum]GGK32581.1 hypothetical protein GCM10010965_26870 [Caldalkalibacillus thermarum]
MSVRVSPTEIEQWLIKRIAEKCKLSPQQINPEDPFSRFGLDSAEAVAIAGELEDWLGHYCPPTLVFDHPSIRLVARYLAGESEPNALSEHTNTRPMAYEPVAIVGMACRFPGASSAEELLENLLNGMDAVREVPNDRWPVSLYYDAKKGKKGKTYTRWGGFIEDIRGFDASFFNINTKEAEKMDPQQRILMEVTWEALEDGGFVPSNLAGSNTGVFIGISTNEYSYLNRTTEQIDAFTGTGNALSIAANRLSYFFNFTGPSLQDRAWQLIPLVLLHWWPYTKHVKAYNGEKLIWLFPAE